MKIFKYINMIFEQKNMLQYNKEYAYTSLYEKKIINKIYLPENRQAVFEIIRNFDMNHIRKILYI